MLPSGTGTFDRTLALHLRRGDYDKACKHLTQYSSLFNGWNQLEFLPDRLSIPQGDTEKAEEYRRRCSPTFDEIMMKIKQARDSYDGALDMLYLLTNEKGQWLDDLVSALRKAGWSTIVTSRDLELVTSEEEEIAMIVDMEIARQAAMFIGNGVRAFNDSRCVFTYLDNLSSGRHIPVVLCIVVWLMASRQLAYDFTELYLLYFIEDYSHMHIIHRQIQIGPLQCRTTSTLNVQLLHY